MKWVDDGGPAFPMPRSPMQHGAVLDSVPGMSLRDYFAAHAPSPIADGATPGGVSELTGVPMPTSQSDAPAWGQFWLKAEAILRYRYADAMIAARKVGAS